MVSVALVWVLTSCGTETATPDAAEDTAADDAAAPVDAECKPSLPECWELGCAVGALPVDCPREDDPSICYCDAVSSVSGWCRNQ